MTIVIWALGFLVILYIAFRLKKSRLIIRSGELSSASASTAIKTPLHELEKTALKILGSRNRGETLVAWLMKLKAHAISETELETACALHQQLRFDPSPDELGMDERLSEVTASLRKQIERLGNTKPRDR